MNPTATHVRLGKLVSPASDRWILLMWNDEQKPVYVKDLAGLPGMNPSRKSIEEETERVKAIAEALLVDEGYRVRGSPMIPPGWSAAWDIIHEGETIEAEVVE